MELCSVLCGSLDGRGLWGRTGTGICMAKSLHCSPETTTTLLTDYSSIQNKKFKVKKKRTLEWVVVSFSRGSSWPRDWTCISLFLSHQRGHWHHLFYRWKVWVTITWKSQSHWDLILTHSLLESPPQPWQWRASFFITLASTCKLRCHHTQQASRCAFRCTQEILTKHYLE